MFRTKLAVILLLLFSIIMVAGSIFGTKNNTIDTATIDEYTQAKDIAKPESVTTTASSTTPATTTTTITTSSTTTSTTTALTTTNTTTSTTSYKAPESLQVILDGMTLEEKVGQMFIARCPQSNAATLASQYHLGGYILFARDFESETKESAKAKIQSYQNSSKIGMLIAVDEEGGKVVRVSKYPNFRSSPFSSQMQLYNSGGVPALASDAKEKSELLLSLGINMNFAPVCDLPDSQSNYIYYRTLGTDVNVTVSGIPAIVTQMNKSGIVSVLKHFPGYGNNSDTHTGSATDSRPYSDFENADFKPFISGINADAPCVLVSHNIINSMDSSSPASLSQAVHNILRNELGFYGVIITDDLAMDAITSYAGSQNVAVMAVNAGNDLICCTDFQNQITAVINAVKSGQISEERINQSVLRILKMKQDYRILS